MKKTTEGCNYDIYFDINFLRCTSPFRNNPKITVFTLPSDDYEKVMTVPVTRTPSSYDEIEDDLEAIFGATNHGSGITFPQSHYERIVMRRSDLRSMCVGDVVVLVEKNVAYLCDKVGWKRLEIKEAENHDEMA